MTKLLEERKRVKMCGGDDERMMMMMRGRTASKNIMRKYRREMIRRAEYIKLKAIVPSVAHKRSVAKLTVIEEAIKYINELHTALKEKLCSRTETTSDLGNGVPCDNIPRGGSYASPTFCRQPYLFGSAPLDFTAQSTNSHPSSYLLQLMASSDFSHLISSSHVNSALSQSHTSRAPLSDVQILSRNI